MELVEGTWVDAGRQENRPVSGLMAASAGAPASSVKVSCWGGASVSVAEAVKTSSWPSKIVLSGIGLMTGGVLVRARKLAKPGVG
jgi:hypothetical protein